MSTTSPFTAVQHRFLEQFPSSPDRAGGFTPSDFPLAQLDQQLLDQLLAANPQIEDVYPLTPMQRDMLLQRCHTQNSELYWLCNRVAMRKSRIDISAFEQAWQRLVDQHAIMRSSFVWDGLDEPLQVVHKQAMLSIEQHDWRTMSPAEQEEHVEAYVLTMRKQGCNLSQAPHTRLGLVRMTDDDYLLVLCSNYMLQDGWSSTLIMRDCNAFYEACCQGQDLHLERPRPYRDHLAWLQQQDMARAETFWRKTLRSFTSSASLRDGARHEAPQAGESFVKQSLPVSVALTTALHAMGRKHQLTMATLLHCAWALVLSRYSGLEDVLFGSLCSGRPATLAGSEYMVGFFNNILPLRVRVLPEAQLLPWLKEMQAHMVELREYEYTPMMKIKEWTGLDQALPMFDSYVVYENFPTYSYATIGKKARKDLGMQAPDDRRFFVPTEYPIRVEFWSSQPLVMTMSGYQRYCDAVTLTHLLRHIKNVLEGMVTDPRQRLGDLMRLMGTE